MLAFTIATFFALALIGALLVISYMFFEYQDKLRAVFIAELRASRLEQEQPAIRITHNVYRHPAVKSRQLNPVRLTRPVSQLRAAA